MRIYLYSFERLASLIFSRLFNRTSELCAWVVICTLARVNNCLMSRGQQFLSVHAAAGAEPAGRIQDFGHADGRWSDDPARNSGSRRMAMS